MCALCERGDGAGEGTGLSGTLHHGTTCLNAATGFRAAGRYEEAEAAYREAEKVYASLLKEPDYRLAGLHNI